MKRGNSLALVVPDPAARPGDRFLNRVARRYVAVGDAIYYVERSTDADELAATWRAAAFAAGRMAIVTDAGLDRPRAGEAALEKAAAGAALVVFEAYDGEGALFFERRSS
jgi:hypothetical protein